MKEAMKDEFRTHLEKLGVITSFQQEGSSQSHGPPYDTALGKYWHEILRKKLNQEKIEEGADDILAGQLIDKLKELYKITLIEPEFLLYGYVYNKTRTASYVYLWKGVKADAIGWHHKEKKYVIVDYKVVDFVKPFWTTPEAYGKFLHQCLVYARLLQLHMKLEYLPPILLVPISNNDACDIHPGLFLNYPDGCKRAINADVWSVTLPKPPLKIKAHLKPSKKNIKSGPVNEEMLLKDLFAAEAKVKDLIKAFDLNSLVVCKPEQGVRVKRRVGTGFSAEFCFIVGFVLNFFRVSFRKCVSYVHVLNFNVFWFWYGRFFVFHRIILDILAACYSCFEEETSATLVTQHASNYRILVYF